MKIKKSKFQLEIEKNEKRLDEIYNKILGVYIPQKDLKIPENSCLIKK